MNNQAKVKLLKGCEDDYWGDMELDHLILNPLSKALTNRYLPLHSLSPLKTMMMKRMGTVKRLYLYLHVKSEHDIITHLSLQCDLIDDVERMYDADKVDWEKVKECVSDYFRSIGFPKTVCTEDADIVSFVQRLGQDIPLAKEHFKIIYKHDENITRIGFMGEKSEYEVYMQTDDEVSEPHFHVRDAETKGARFETCVCIETNRYCPHGNCKDGFSEDIKKELMDFMKRTTPTSQRCSTPTCNYERVVDMWNLNNESTQVTLKRNEGGDVVIPIYSEMEDRL